MQSVWKRQARVHATAGVLAVLCVLLAVAGRGRGAEPAAAGAGRHAPRLPARRRAGRDLHDQGRPDAERRRPAADDRLGRRRFGGPTQNFIVHAIANLTVPTAGTYEFRLRSDDGSELLIDDALVIDHDGLHGAEDKDGSVELTAGVHALRVNFFEAGGDQELHLSWRKPGDSGFTIVPTTALSTDAGVVRVTAPGTKQCEGDDRHARRRAAARRRQPRLRPRRPAAGRLRAEGDRPRVDGRRPARPHLGRRRRRPEQRHGRRRDLEAERRQGRRRPRRRHPHQDRRGPARADGHQGRRRRHLRLREAPAEQADRRRRQRDLRGEGRRSPPGRSTATSTSSRSASSTRTATST